MAAQVISTSGRQGDLERIKEAAKIVEAGGHLWACRMSVDMMKLTKDDFIPEVEDIINVSEFLDLSRDGQLMFV